MMLNVEFVFLVSLRIVLSSGSLSPEFPSIYCVVIQTFAYMGLISDLRLYRYLLHGCTVTSFAFAFISVGGGGSIVMEKCGVRYGMSEAY